MAQGNKQKTKLCGIPRYVTNETPFEISLKLCLAATMHPISTKNGSFLNQKRYANAPFSNAPFGEPINYRPNLTIREAMLAVDLIER